MRALSLTQPWASLVATGAKQIETRSWSTPVRGPIAIHAAKNFPAWAKENCIYSYFQRALEPIGINSLDDLHLLPTGAIIAVADLAACVSTNGGVLNLDGKTYKAPLPGTPENAFGDFSRNRYMYFLENVCQLPEPIPCRGALSFWEVPEDINQQILNLIA